MRTAFAVRCAAALILFATAPVHAQLDTVTITVSEGTLVAHDVARDGRIAFDLLGQLWLLPRGGGAAWPLTDAAADTAEDLDPAFSPDARRVAFTGERAGRAGLWLLDVEDGRIEQLVQHADADSYAGAAAWSPDGRTIAFARAFPADTMGPRRARRIVLLDVATREMRRLAVTGVSVPDMTAPTWSPDGSRIAFVAGRGGAGRICVVPATGGAAVALTPESVRAMAPAFSPDGGRIAYLAPDSAGRLQVWVQEVAADGATLVSATREPPRATRLTDADEVAPTRVRWSPDGARIHYSARGKLRSTAPADGASAELPFTAALTLVRPRRALPPVPLPEPGVERAARGFTGLALSADARAIAILALRKLWIVPTDGSAARAVAEVPHTAKHAAWSPDGGEVAWSAGGGDELDVFATNVASGETRRVTALPGRELYATYSPDGRHLAFVHDHGGTRLRIAAARGGTVSDTTSASALGNAQASWTASGAFTPMWSPASDALVHVVGGEPGSGGHGERVRLSGEHDVASLPDVPLHASWSAGALTYVEHDRLWRVPFDGSAMRGAPQPLGDSPALYATSAPDGTVLFVSGDGLRLRTPAGAERSLGWPVRYTPPVAEPLLVRNVRIIDGTGARASEPRDLLIEHGRIARIAAAGSITQPSARVLDARGGWAMPGLMDLHAHGYWPEVFPGFLYFGVTVVRDQGSAIAPIAALSDAVAAGVVPSPRVLYGGFQYYSDWSHDDEQGRGIEPEADAGHVGRAVALAQAFGAQHIKTRTFRRWDINAHMIEEAHRHGLRATGHCALQLPLVRAGMDAKEHAGSCGSRGNAGPLGDLLQYDDADQLLRAAGIGVVPTISYFAFAARLNEQHDLLARDAELAPFLLDSTSFGWMLNMDTAGRARMARAGEHARRTTARLARAGVTLGTGTDIWQVPTGTHMELEELVTAGLTPLEAIRAATLGSARIAGVERDLGSIEVGKRADLVLLEADPSADIRNTRRIRAVVLDGRVVDRAEIRDKYAVRPAVQ